MIRNSAELLNRLREIQAAVRDRVLRAFERSPLEQLAAAVGSEGGDTIFAIDRISEQALLDQFQSVAQEWPCLLVAEGLGETGQAWLPAGVDPARVEVCIIFDPIDGTRGLMYQKRPAWVLAGAAPWSGRTPTLREVEIAVQTEIPLLKQYLSDSFWAAKRPDGQVDLGGERLNRLTGERLVLAPRPSQATTIEQGFGSISRFFPGMRGLLAALDDAVVHKLLGPLPPGRAVSFEDQYISSGGQLYELLMGHDRWVADLRPLVWQAHNYPGISSHPYDLCTELIARAAGVIVTDPYGQPLDVPLDVETGVAFAAFANQALFEKVMPALQEVMKEFGLIEDGSSGGSSPLAL